ncbi:hypothetical protein KC19_4G224800 [Ceratodon purpureus]|uniref:Uncharacterized protein n=1 Tax=Ceratodon purpureus TaxID=3225 RepID=A0A8T0IDV0_CERPU|nr:hypothetical protein KC19_4G224800 [Ceratodon purpureus]
MHQVSAYEGGIVFLPAQEPMCEYIAKVIFLSNLCTPGIMFLDAVVSNCDT